MGALSTVQTGSATALGYCLENAVDFLGSVLVLWRFAGSTSKETLDSREQRADAGISIMFIVLGFVVAYDGAKDLLQHDRDRDVGELIALYAPSMIIFLLLGLAKLHVGKCVNSLSLQKDGMCSLAGALLSAGVLVSAVIEDLTPVWWVDSFVAVIVAHGLAVKGAMSLHAFSARGIYWWRLSFWRGTAAILPSDDLDQDQPLLAKGPPL
ncbi:hypothetical protein CTAYLR_003750 [Chrysophaeum taylorii]|uniref:Cation efflux protein transmembrane domain-containing protein n=1 Tax=Chrysophaeum taylorii TaxID=2483200 RepID=A0AAD7XKE2_9STRA|nr:hypothetical protein CTAYLR_003750 [Chrysophaeum taylorii]